MVKVNVAVIGCGTISKAHLNPYKEHEDVILKAVTDLDEEKARARGKEYGINWYTSIDKMFDKEDIQAVSLCTPPSSHRAILENIAQRKVDVFCEKPLAGTVEDAETMVECAKENGIQLLVAVCHRFHEPVVQVKKLIDKGTLGQIVNFRNRFQYLDTASLDVIKGRGGILLDNGAHSVDLFRFLVGEVKEVSAAFGTEVADIAELRQLNILLISENSALGIIELDGRSTASAGKDVIEIFGTKGMACISYFGGDSYYKTKDEGQKVIEIPADLPGSHRFTREIDHFIQCVKGEEEPRISGEEGLNDLKVIEAVYQAGKEGKRIRI